MNDLPRQTQLLQTFLNTKSQHANYQIVNSRLHAFMQLLTITNSHVNVELTLKVVPCAVCPGKVTAKSGLVSLTCCGASVCNRDCFRKFVYEATNGSLLNLESVLCPRCQTYLGKPQCLSYFSEWEIYTCNEKSRRGDQPAAPAGPTTFLCSLHYDDTPISDLVPLTCGHKVCKDCVQGHIEAKIDEGKGEITCPTSDCPTLLTDNHVRTFAPKLYELYQKLSFSSARSNIASEQEVLFECPTVNCRMMIVVPVNVFTYTCSLCHKTYCPQCQNVVHPNMTCQQYFDFLQAEQKRLHQNQADEAATTAYFQNLPGKKYRQCPKCKVWIERSEGCKYMTCMSQTCQGKTFFCMECMTKLESKHGSHKCIVEGFAFL